MAFKLLSITFAILLRFTAIDDEASATRRRPCQVTNIAPYFLTTSSHNVVERLNEFSAIREVLCVNCIPLCLITLTANSATPRAKGSLSATSFYRAVYVRGSPRAFTAHLLHPSLEGPEEGPQHTMLQ
eukprot:4516082-Amphidinium_carterae.1